MSVDADVVILGGGCSGLSLAVALVERAPNLRIKVLEGRAQYRRDRTWCFWNTAPHPFSAGVTRRWSDWRVRWAGLEARQHSRRYAYEHLPADRFYDIATGRLREAGQELAMEVQVRTVRQTNRICETETDRGVLRSHWVFDSRPRNAQEVQPVLAQRFVGWQIRTEHPCFDDSIVDLMDFQSSMDPSRTMFYYMLPFSPTEALIEATYLDVPVLPAADAEAALRDHVEQLCGAGYEVLYREAATLPMGERCAPTRPSGPVVDIGARGGRIKASSGYGFMRMQRQSTALAVALARGTTLPQSYEPRFYGALDTIFLQALQRSPERAPSYFLSMFRHLSPETLVRFLSETASAREVLQVVLTLPKLDFLKAAMLPAASADPA